MAQNKDIQNTSVTIALMEQFETVDDLANVDLDELTAFITEVGHGRFADPTATARAIRAAARGSYRLPKTVNDTVNQAIERQFEIIPNTLLS